MSRVASLGVVLGLLTCLPQQALGWNSIGHMAIARLAHEQLTDAQRLQVFRILQKHPHYDEFLAKHRPEGVAEDEWVFLRASTWSDWVRPRGRPGEADPRGERVVKYHRRDDHFINRPFVPPTDRERFAEKDLQPDGDMHTVLSAYTQRVGELTLATTSTEDKAIAICWLLHLIGDIHQPLHAASQYSSLFPDRGGDLGGNLFGIKANGRALNLHRLWDDLLGDDPNYLDDAMDRQVRIHRLAREAAEGLRGEMFGREALQKELTGHRDFPSWIQESYEIAKEVVYREGQLKPVRVREGRVPPEAEEVGQDYLKTARETARKRAALAGHRTADKLKTFLTKVP